MHQNALANSCVCRLFTAKGALHSRFIPGVDFGALSCFAQLDVWQQATSLPHFFEWNCEQCTLMAARISIFSDSEGILQSQSLILALVGE